jgi:phosphinothricin acetyltransferase
MDMHSPQTEIRSARPDDAAAIADVYARCIHNGQGAFEDAADARAIERRYRQMLAGRMPFLVACRDAAIVGFGHANGYLPGAGFGHCAQSAVWIEPDWRAKGIGWALLRDLLLTCRGVGLRQLVAYVRADSEAALAVHASLGFAVIGWHREACHAGGQLHDVVALRRVLDRIASAASPHFLRQPGIAAVAARADRLGIPAGFDRA